MLNAKYQIKYHLNKLRNCLGRVYQEAINCGISLKKNRSIQQHLPSLKDYFVIFDTMHKER